MTKEEVQQLIELKQSDMPFDVREREEALPSDGQSIIKDAVNAIS